MSQIVSLRNMRVGQQGKIATVEALGEMNRRIRDMGLIPGTTVSIVGRAPLKDPVALRLSGVTISLRNSEADYIKVDISGSAHYPFIFRHHGQSCPRCLSVIFSRCGEGAQLLSLFRGGFREARP